MKKIDSDFVERVRFAVNIVDLVGGYVNLRKRGQNYVALCPFHQEKTPSFSVNESRQIFKCFGCGEGGDAFGFVQKVENLTFPESIRFLAERQGIPLPEAPEEATQQSKDRERFLGIMQQADLFFREQLAHSNEGLGYLDRRQISQETREVFGIGFAQPGNALLRQFRSKGIAVEDLEACGLVSRSASGEPYDKFRSRVIFPIRNLSGKTIAFGGRILGDGQPKYLNSPETVLYSKGNNLFGLHAGRDAIRKQGFAVLVEGYFDCIVPFQHGVRNIIASLGTSLTDGQVRLISRYTRRVVVNFDPDSAGISAALRSINLFLEQGFQVNVLRLPGGDDPDSFILHHGVSEYLRVLKESSPFVDFLLSHFLSQQRDPHSPKGKQEVIDQVLPFIAKLPHRVERAEYLSKVSSRLLVDEEVLVGELRKYSRSPREQKQLGIRPAPRIISEPTLAEKSLFSACLEESTRDLVFALAEPTMFEGLAAGAIFRQIFELRKHNDQFDIFKLRERLEDDELDLFDRLSVTSSELQVSDEDIRRCVEAIEDLALTRISRQIQQEIAREEKSGHTSERLEELLRQKELNQRRRRR